jgi:hypothetical protein
MEKWEPVPLELLIGCFVLAGLLISIIYSIDWSIL